MTKFKDIFRRALPTLTAVVLFFVVSAIGFAPQFEGRVLQQHDVQQFDGMSRDIRVCRNEAGEDPQWTGAMFGGMPAYLINIRYPSQILKRSVDTVVEAVKSPLGMIFFAMLSAWLMCVLMGLSAWVGLLAGLAYGLSTYFFLIIGAGHITKMWALVWAPALMGAIFMTLRGDWRVGGVLSALFASLEIGANHPQITYYFLLAALALWVSDGIFALRQKALKAFGIRTAALLGAAILAVGSNFAPLYYTMRHTGDTIRGGSEVAKNVSSGLDIGYATSGWSYGLDESWTMLIPNFMGGSSATTFSRNGEVAESLRDLGLQSLATELPTYWGDQLYTAGPTYIGAVAIFLALLGLLLVRGRDRWWIVAVSLLSLVLAWGQHAMWFTELCFKYLPLYNKFRTVSMSLVVLEWSVPLLVAMGVGELWRRREERKVVRRAVIISSAVVGGMTLLMAVVGPSIFDFGREESADMMSEQFRYMLQMSGGEEYVKQGLHEELGWDTAEAMVRERGDILAADAWRSFGFVAAAAVVLLLFVFGFLRKELMLGGLALLVVADVLPVNLRFLPYDAFQSPRKVEPRPTEADVAITKDKELGYRVLNLSVSPFNDATTSLYHRSVGGYHGAKLGRYQDLIDTYLSRGNEEVYDILNTKYMITRGGEVVERPTACGAAWFVARLAVAPSPAEELAMLGKVDLHNVAVVDTSVDSSRGAYGDGEIELKEYRPNYLRYEYEADGESTIVFSEVYYSDGWSMSLDGEAWDYFRADYLLRAAVVPAGKHTIEWRFRAPHWTATGAVTLICSILIIIALLLTLLYYLGYGKRRCNIEA